MLEINPVERITVGAIGEPGERVFYLQARGAQGLFTVIVEKQQVQLLAATVLEILARLGQEVDVATPSEGMDLEEPVEPLWRAGRIALGYEEESGLVLLEVHESEDEDAEDGEAVRLWATAAQMLALAQHGVQVVAAGRPTCQYCGNPIDPDGHVCVAMNGHGDAKGEA